MDSGFQVLDFGSLSKELGLWISIIIGISDSSRRIPDPEAQNAGLQKQKFPAFRNPHTLHADLPRVPNNKIQEVRVVKRLHPSSDNTEIPVVLNLL